MKLKLTSTNDHIQKKIKNTGEFYELDMLRDVEERLKKRNNVVVDAGAYIGNHTLFFATHCNARAVISFEPFPESFKSLQENISLNNLQHKVTAHNFALGSEEARADMIVADQRNIGMNRVDTSNTGSVEVKTLDGVLLGKIERVDVIKIDVEGMEVPLLKGAMNTIDRYSPLLYIEAFEMDRLREIIKILSPLGYGIVDVFNATPTFLFVRNKKSSLKKILNRI